MSRDFPDNSEQLFGREPDLDYLTKRSQKPGVTAVLGRPQMGKTWLLLELGRRLSAKPHAHDALSLHQPLVYRVGYFESPGEGADVLLRSVIDLYDRWLADSTYRQQAHVIYQRHKKDFIGRTGEAFGSVMEKAVSIGPGAALGSLTKKTFEGLAAANRDLNNSAGQFLPRLQIEQARELLELVHKVTQQKLVLIFDQWEKSSALQTEANLLDSFLRQLSNWPPCHIFVGARPDASVKDSLDPFFSFFPGKAETYDLPPMHLEGTRSQTLVFNYLCKTIPGAAAQKESELLKLIAGYPGTIGRWTSEYFAAKLRSFDQFERVAKEAQRNQFSEFKVLLKDLPKPLLLLSIRLALLPLTGYLETWNALKPVVLQDFPSIDLDELRRRKVLESLEPPSFGHATRAAAALSWLQDQQNYHYQIRDACEDLIYQLSAQVKDLSASEVPYLSSLQELLATANELQLEKLPRALCLSAVTTLGLLPGRPDMFVGAALESKKAPSSCALLAIGLFNTLVDAKQEQALERRDALLEELRQLHAAYPEDAAVREQLAKGLFTTLIAAKQEQALERRDALLQELRQLHAAYPEGATVRESLVIGLLNTLVAAKQEQALERGDTLLQELHKFYTDYPNDPIWIQFSQRLGNAGAAQA